MQYANRKVSAYSIHAHGKQFDGNYDAVFKAIYDLEKTSRFVKISSMTVGIPDVVQLDADYFLTFIEGEEGVQPLIFDSQTGSTYENELEAHEILVSASHALVVPAKRRILIEYVKSAPKAPIMERVIEQLLQRKYGDDFRISFSPIVEENFVREINKFKRIRVASLTLIKPNAGWDDHYTKISKMLEESGGEKADLSVRAARGETLSKNAGIVEVIKDVANDHQPYLVDAEIIGTKEGEEVETRVPLNQHVVHRNISVQKQKNGSLNVLRLREKMRELVGSLF